ncbi:glycosyltransferase family 4 protein [Microbacterium sp. Bi121]|uniref:glycosyltransferase family 4 protein n=1 Tax=Microbacterium sp. Bi121 TaxID=2822348 RepID=UPI001DC4D681|nr:glycosyltransferase family 4 protein [Microbacterium sp. Bi121]CAH0122847.1 GDP-mannose-dependent alpha-(1-6)-phosphatidylinositol monomannoside mannosyltransferase [Microbacterium sp. Bi121]
MRVLVILNSLELGGTQINAVDFARTMRGRGIESTLVGPRESGGGPSLLDYAAAQVVEVREYDPAHGVMAQARQLHRMADELSADLVHVYGMWGAARPAYWGPARFGRRPWAQTVYEMSVTSVVHRNMPLVVGTEYLVEELEHRPGRTILVSPPVDLGADSPEVPGAEAFRAEHDLGEGPLLGIVSRLEPRLKGTALAVAIDSMRVLSATGATLFVVGSGEAEGSLRRLAEAVNDIVGRPAVRMLGALADPRPAYAAADIVLGMGGSAARALAFGRPLIVQGEAGWSCLFDEGTARMLARSSYWSPERPERPVEDLVKIAEPLIADRERRVALGALGRDFAVDRFGLDAMSERMAQFYAHSVDAYGLREWLLDLPREGRRLAERVGRRMRPRVPEEVTT